MGWKVNYPSCTICDHNVSVSNISNIHMYTYCGTKRVVTEGKAVLLHTLLVIYCTVFLCFIPGIGLNRFFSICSYVEERLLEAKRTEMVVEEHLGGKLEQEKETVH